MNRTGLPVSQPLVTVLIPAYNAEEYIEQSVRAVMAQSYGHLEILVINDGSQDRTGAILDHLAQTDARLRVVHNSENLQLIATLNKGLDLARGEYIARTDADDIAHPHWIEKLLNFLRQHPHIGAAGAGIRIFSKDPQTDGYDVVYPQHHHDIIREMIYRNPFAHPTMMMRAELLRRHGLRYDAGYAHAEDYKLWLEISKISQMANLPDILLAYRIHTNNTSILNKAAQLAATRKISQEAIANFLHIHHNIAFTWPSWPKKLLVQDLLRFTEALQNAQKGNLKSWRKFFLNMILSVERYRFSDIPKLIRLACAYHFRYPEYRNMIRKILRPHRYQGPF